jgi:hypothetical protein
MLSAIGYQLSAWGFQAPTPTAIPRRRHPNSTLNSAEPGDKKLIADS